MWIVFMSQLRLQLRTNDKRLLFRLFSFCFHIVVIKFFRTPNILKHIRAHKETSKIKSIENKVNTICIKVTQSTIKYIQLPRKIRVSLTHRKKETELILSPDTDCQNNNL